VADGLKIIPTLISIGIHFYEKRAIRFYEKRAIRPSRSHRLLKLTNPMRLVLEYTEVVATSFGRESDKIVCRLTATVADEKELRMVCRFASSA